MKYESLIDIIRTAAEAALAYGVPEGETPGTFIHARKADYNLQYDAPFPHINFFEPTDTSNNINPAIRSFRCTFLFNKNESDTLDTSERENIISDMDVLCRRFFDELDKAELIELTGQSREIVVRQYQARATGYAAQCTIIGAMVYENCSPDEIMPVEDPTPVPGPQV